MVIIFILMAIGVVAIITFVSTHTKKNPNMINVLCGEVLDIIEDEETGLSCIIAKDNTGQTQTGVSNLSVAQLEALYAGKGYVQIPVISMTK